MVQEVVQNNLVNNDPFEGISNLGFLPYEPVNTLPPNLVEYNILLEHLKNQDRILFFDDLSKLPKYNEQQYYQNINELDLLTVKYIYSVFSIFCHYYIWTNGVKDVKQKIPITLGGYWYYSAKRLGLPCVLTHASVDLYNWKYVNKNEKFSLDNIECINLLTAKEDEEWFYKIMIAIEGICGHLLYKIKNFNLEKQEVEQLLREISEALDESTTVIKRLREKCDPNFFFNELRIFLSGGNNKNIFPNGIILEEINSQPLNYTGGSAAQSTLFQVFDALFEIKHVDHGKDFLMEMRKYMPATHKQYLEEIEMQPKLKGFIEQSQDEELILLFNTCLNKLEIFRGVHLNIVHQYIFKFIENKEQTEENNNVNKDKGTGGTDPKEFLGSVIKNVGSTKIKYDNKKIERDIYVGLDDIDSISRRDNFLTSYVNAYFVFLAITLSLVWLWRY